MSLLSWITEKELEREIKKKKAKAANFVTRITWRLENEKCWRPEG